MLFMGGFGMKIDIGSRLKQLVRETGKEQQQIAYELGMKVPTFNGYVNNSREPSIEKLIQIARYFNVSVDYLVGNSPDRNTSISHLSDELKAFVTDPSNDKFIKAAKNLKDKSIALKNRKNFHVL